MPSSACRSTRTSRSTGYRLCRDGSARPARFRGAYRLGHPLRERPALARRPHLAATTRDLGEPPQALAPAAARARHRPRRGIRARRTESSARDPLPHLGERDGREVEHRLRGEQVEVRHRLVRARDQRVDLVRLGRQRALVAIERLARPACGARRRILEHQPQPLDGAQPPRDPRREQRIDERVRMRQHRPSRAGRARQPMLDARHARRSASSASRRRTRADRRISLAASSSRAASAPCDAASPSDANAARREQESRRSSLRRRTGASTSTPRR